ncbi:MAG: MBOAT family O-acyltransferase [Blautia coccoides]
MLLNSLFFIFAFLPVVLFLYYVLPAGGRNLFLLAASLMFYAWGDPVYLILLIFSTVFHYVMGQQIGREAQEKRRQKLDLLFAAGVDVFLLCFFKYFGPAAELLGSLLHTQLPVRELALPIGLSFYTFKNMSYLFDIYYGRTEAEKNFTDFAAYGVFFPIMTAGPIVRYEDVKRQIKKRRVNALQLGYGARRFILGLAKKVLLADTLASLYGEISAGAGDISVLTAWIGMFAFTMEIYFDFSGYSDMAIGISRMLGFTVKENFDYPYTSKSITEFWRRWHISLGSWFRDYIYIPLGGNRAGIGKHIRNILIVWCLTGMWHGASLNFPVWGLYYGILLIGEKYFLGSRLKKLPGWISGAYTMLFVMVGWMLFSHESLGDAGIYLKRLAGIGAAGFADGMALYYLKTNFLIFLFCIPACRPGFFRWVESRIHDSAVGSALLYGALFLLSTASLVFSSYHPFLYLRF